MLRRGRVIGVGGPRSLHWCRQVEPSARNTLGPAESGVPHERGAVPYRIDRESALRILTRHGSVLPRRGWTLTSGRGPPSIANAGRRHDNRRHSLRPSLRRFYDSSLQALLRTEGGAPVPPALHRPRPRSASTGAAGRWPLGAVILGCRRRTAAQSHLCDEEEGMGFDATAGIVKLDHGLIARLMRPRECASTL